HLADGGAAAHVHHPHLAGRHPERGVLSLSGDQLDAGTSRPGELGATTGPEFDRVDRGSDRDVAERQVVARLDVGALARFNLTALTKAFRSDDVSLLPI